VERAVTPAPRRGRTHAPPLDLSRLLLRLPLRGAFPPRLCLQGSGGPPRCGASRELEGERFLWYATHNEFSNQVGELRNAAVAAALLNHTLVVPPGSTTTPSSWGAAPSLGSLTPARYAPLGPRNAAPSGAEVKMWFTLSDCYLPPVKRIKG
jgi:hypothetical protein